MALSPVDLLLSKAARGGAAPVIALAEGEDPRIVAAAVQARGLGIARIVLVGKADLIRAQLIRQNSQGQAGIAIHDPATSSLQEEFAQAYHALQSHKGIDKAAAHAAVRRPLEYAAMLVRMGHAAGTIGGALATTPQVVRTALTILRPPGEKSLVSSFFLMLPPRKSETNPNRLPAMLYADCGLVIDPSPLQLAAIALASADSCRTLLRQEPKIAMLSFSTKGSATHPAADKVIQALQRVRHKAPDLIIDGELQFDAAFVPAVARRKAARSPIAGAANVMIFPNLDAGNIAYKITERLGGYQAIGPILQGLARPANDLSRGCSAEDVVQMIAVTVLQAQARSQSN